MVLRFAHVVRVAVVFCLVIALVTPQLVYAQSSVVQPSELKDAIAKVSASRQKNLKEVRSFFASEPVRNALKSAGLSSVQIEKSVATLSADELAKLAARTQKVQADFAAGALSNQELTYVVIALATAVVILIIVAAD